MTNTRNPLSLRTRDGVLTYAQHDQNFENLMRWAGVWADPTPGVYRENQIVRDGAWTMLANTDTAERAAPQAGGSPHWLLPDLPVWTDRTEPGISYTGVDVVINEILIAIQVRAWIPQVGALINYTIALIDFNDPANPSLIQSYQIEPDETGWFNITIDPSILSQGQHMRIVLVTQSIDAPAGTWTHDWTFVTATPLPFAGEYTTLQAQQFVVINAFDNGATDQSADLDLVSPGDELLMEEANANRFTRYQVVSANLQAGVYTFEVFLIDNGLPIRVGDSISITAFLQAGSATSPYVELTDWWLTNDPVGATLQGFATGDLDNITLTDNAYGIDIEATYFDASDDWDLVAFSGSLTALPPIDILGTPTEFIGTIESELGHSLLPGNHVYFDGIVWHLAIAIEFDTLAQGYVAEIDGDEFLLVSYGFVNAPAHGFPQGETLYLSDGTPGGVTTVDLLDPGSVAQARFEVINADRLKILDQATWVKN